MDSKGFTWSVKLGGAMSGGRLDFELDHELERLFAWLEIFSTDSGESILSSDSFFFFDFSFFFTAGKLLGV